MIIKKLLDQKTQDMLAAAVKNIKADYAEIRAEESTSTRVVYKGENPDLIAQPQSLGFFVRVLINGSWGIATFTDLSKLKEKIDQAVHFAKLQGQGNIILSNVPIIQKNITVDLKKDFREIDLFKKVSLTKNYNEIILKSEPSVQNTNTVYMDNYLVKFFVNSQGSKILQERPYTMVNYRAFASHNDVVEMYAQADGHVGGFEIAEGLDEKMAQVGRDAALVARSPKVKSGKYTVILDPYMTGTFAHEAFGHFSEADHQYENSKILEQMAIGRKLGSEKVTIIDDPDMKDGWGNFVYDDEGVLAEKVYLLDKGIIAGRLHSKETAAKLNEKPNGRARADGFRSKPIIRMSNTYFAKGQDKLEDLIVSTPNGILVCSWTAGMTAMENFTFTAQYGVMIENGKLTNKVRGVKLSGNVFETLNNIDGVSNDSVIDEGFCGKEGQTMYVGSGGAYIRINDVSVGGD